jgi:hypothetical protein
MTIAAVAAAIACLLAEVAPGRTSSAGTTPSLMKLLLTVDDMAPGYRVSTRAQAISARTETRYFKVRPLELVGYAKGVKVAFQRKRSRPDTAVDRLEIHMMSFISEDAAHEGFQLLVHRETGRSFNVGRIGAESVGRKIRRVIGLREVIWRHRNIVVYLRGAYLTDRNNVLQLLSLARAQQAKLANSPIGEG